MTRLFRNPVMFRIAALLKAVELFDSGQMGCLGFSVEIDQVTTAGRLVFKLEKCSVKSWGRQYENQRAASGLALVGPPPGSIPCGRYAFPTPSWQRWPHGQRSRAISPAAQRLSADWSSSG
jgi:hypothetical protein